MGVVYFIMRRNVDETTQNNARSLRRQLTPTERILWQRLRMKQLLGLRIRRQHPIGKFIVDFYIEQCNLVIEIDGESHDHTVGQDKIRDDYLKKNNYTVMRFKNNDIHHNLDSVLEAIRQYCLENTQPPS